MNNSFNQQNILIRILKENGASLIGFGDISNLDHSHTLGFSTVISFAVHLDHDIVNKADADENVFYDHTKSVNIQLIRLIEITEYLLDSWGYQYKSIEIPRTITSNEQLEAAQQFSHKMAATISGLGWIGKSGLLITPEFGPRVRIYSILTNADFNEGKPIEESHCGNCSLCVDACPAAAIQGSNWNEEVNTNQLVDIYSCNSYRLSFIQDIDRKSECGLCIKACKIGQNSR